MRDHDTGYQCGVCGYEPDFNELNRGSCPVCREDERRNGPKELQEIKALPIGGTVDVRKSDIIHPTCESRLQDSQSSDPSRKTWWSEQILARFLCIGIKTDGSRVFRPVSEPIAVEARDCYEEDRPGTGTKRIIQRWSQMPRVRKGDLPEWTAEQVHGWYRGERTYRAWIVIRDNIPTNQDLARERMREQVGA